MTVKQLIKELKKLKTEAQVILASDPEGNTFRSVWSLEYFPGGPEVVIWPGEEVE